MNDERAPEGALGRGNFMFDTHSLAAGVCS